MDVGDIGLVKQWFVDNEAFLSAVTALIAIASGAFLVLRQTIGAVSNRGALAVGSGETFAELPPEKVVDGKPTIAVLPFRLLSQGEEEKYLAEGLADDIIVNLSYSRLFPVISSATSFRFRNSDESISAIGGHLDAHYIVTGTVGRAADRLRITVELNDCKNGRQLWSDRYTRPAGDIFKLQEEISDTLISKLNPALRADAISRARRAPSHSELAWNHALKGLYHYNKYKRSTNEVAIEEYRAALKVDPEFAQAHAMLALAYYMRSYLGWSEDPVADMVAAGRSAQTAVDIDPDLAEAYLILTYNALMTGDFDLAEQQAKRALSLNPCSGHCWLGVGLVSLYRGRHSEAAQHFERVERLNPNDPVRWIFRIAAGVAAMMEGNYEQALDHAAIARTQRQGQEAADLISCAALLALGRDDDAMALLAAKEKEQVLHYWPRVLSRLPFEDRSRLDFLIDLVARLVPELRQSEPNYENN
ncbi:MAG: tetratricopeptide repeat protein [Pseudomonadota bacterium]